LTRIQEISKLVIEMIKSRILFFVLIWITNSKFVATQNDNNAFCPIDMQKEPLRDYGKVKKLPCLKPCLRYCLQPPPSPKGWLNEKNQSLSTTRNPTAKLVNFVTLPFSERKCELRSRKHEYGRCWPDWMGYGSCKEQLKKRYTIFVENNTMHLKITDDEENKTLSSIEFCIHVDENGLIRPEYCVTKQKLLFQPYVLLISCHLTLATFVIINVKGADADFSETKLGVPLLRHCIMNLVFAFHIKLVHKLVPIYQLEDTLCKIMGYLELFFFLAFFAKLNLINLVRFLGNCTKILHNGSVEDQNEDQKKFQEKLFKIGIITQYVLTFLWTVSAGVFEAFGPRCSPYKPDFENKFCFLASSESKGLWLYLPIFVSIILCFTFNGFIYYKKRTITKLLVMTCAMAGIWLFEILFELFIYDDCHAPWQIKDVFTAVQGILMLLTFLTGKKTRDAIAKKF